MADLGTWARRQWQEFLDWFTAPENNILWNQILARSRAVLDGVSWHGTLSVVNTAVELVNTGIVSLTPAFVGLSASTMRQITGIPIDSERLIALTGGTPSRAVNVEVGDAFRVVIDNMFPIGVSAEGLAQRTTRGFAVDNLNAYFGTNLLFQLRSLTIATVASFIPQFQLRHLEGLHQSVNWAFGFGWLSWTVMSAIMDITTTKPLREYYLARTKPNDYSEAQVINAFLQGRETPEVFNQVLDNQGLRSDIRQHLVDMAEDNLTESDVRELFQRGRLTEPQVLSYFRGKGFREGRARHKTNLVVESRVFDLVDRITASYHRLYRDGVVDVTQYRGWLDSQNWTSPEQDLAIAWQELERRQRSFLSTTALFNAVEQGLLSVTEAKEELEFRGFTPIDATVTTILEMVKRLPKDCFDTLDDKAAIDAVKAFGLALDIPGSALSSNLLRFFQCLISR